MFRRNVVGDSVTMRGDSAVNGVLHAEFLQERLAFQAMLLRPQLEVDVVQHAYDSPVVLFLGIQLNSAVINQITRSDGIAILLFFAIFLYYLISLALHSRDKNKREKPKWKLGLSFLFTALGLAGIIFGSNFVVDSASAIATQIGVSERIIALTVIAIGTSLPELVTTVVAAKKGETELVIGNILGSNIFNICVVLGIPVAIFGAVTASGFSIVDLVALVGSATLLFIFSVTNHKINRIEGGLMLTAFVAYYTLVFVL